MGAGHNLKISDHQRLSSIAKLQTVNVCVPIELDTFKA